MNRASSARTRRTRSSSRFRAIRHAGLLLLLLGCLTGQLGGSAPAQAAAPFLRRTAAVEVVEKVGPSVVNITTERVTRTASPFLGRPGFDPFVDEFFGNFFERRPRTVQSLGSGVIIDREGHVLTNEHVIARADRVKIAIADGREFEAELVGADATNDLAVLRIASEEDLPFTPLGRSDDLMVGEPVIAIGNPFGFSNSVTTGVISATDRSVRAESHTFHGLLQTDALINPGNSGGPLLNAEGDLIGINTAIYGGAQGIGFAIPIGMAERVIRELLLYGEVQPVWLGLEFQDLDPALREVMGLPKGLSGALVNRLHSGGPASKAGIRRGDIIASLDGRSIESAQQLFEMLQGMTAGQRITLEVYRQGRLRRIDAVAEGIPEPIVLGLASRMFGLDLQRARSGDYFEIREVVSGSPAQAMGIRAGDALLDINGVALRRNEDLRRAVARLRGHTRASIVVQRGTGRYRLTIPLQ